MKIVKLVNPEGVEKEFEKTHAERILCIQFKHKIPTSKSWTIAEGYQFTKTNSDSDCNCGSITKKVTISKAKSVKE